MKSWTNPNVPVTVPAGGSSATPISLSCFDAQCGVHGYLLAPIPHRGVGQWERTRMIRKIAMAGAAGAVALSGLAVLGGGTAGAGPIVITAGPGSSLDCNLAAATAKVKPALKDDWIKADHQSDPNAQVRALPNT